MLDTVEALRALADAESTDGWEAAAPDLRRAAVEIEQLREESETLRRLLREAYARIEQAGEIVTKNPARHVSGGRVV